MATCSPPPLCLDAIIAALRKAATRTFVKQPLSEAVLTELLLRGMQALLEGPSLLQVEPPVHVVGDLLGDNASLDVIIESCGDPAATPYLFLGNYVDRGRRGIETFCLVLALLLRYPDRVHALRGKHESGQISRIYGFYDEVKMRYNIKTWKRFRDCFECLPPAAVIGHRIFCASGGISPALKSLHQIAAIQRPIATPDEGVLCDLLWSDPDDSEGWHDSDRGVSYTWGPDVAAEFVHRHDLSLICRSQQVVADGYSYSSNQHAVTIFSQRDHAGRVRNPAAVMKVDGDCEVSFRLFPSERPPSPSDLR